MYVFHRSRTIASLISPGAKKTKSKTGPLKISGPVQNEAETLFHACCCSPAIPVPCRARQATTSHSTVTVGSCACAYCTLRYRRTLAPARLGPLRTTHDGGWPARPSQTLSLASGVIWASGQMGQREWVVWLSHAAATERYLAKYSVLAEVLQVSRTPPSTLSSPSSGHHPGSCNHALRPIHSIHTQAHTTTHPYHPSSPLCPVAATCTALLQQLLSTLGASLVPLSSLFRSCSSRPAFFGGLLLNPQEARLRGDSLSFSPHYPPPSTSNPLSIGEIQPPPSFASPGL